MADEPLARAHQAVGAYQQTVCALGSAGTRRLAVSGARSPRVHHAARRRGGRLAALRRRAAGREHPPHLVLTAGVGADDPDAQAGNAAFVLALQQLGWTSGGNLRIDYFWGSGQDDLAALASDVILASGTASLAALLQATRMVPIVFVNVADPVGAGFVDSLGQPGGKVT